MNIKQLRTFIPSKDFNVSKKFYLDLGFKIQWEGTDLIIFGDDHYSFFLQDFYNKEWAENFMIQLFVDDLDGLFDTAKRLVLHYEGTKIRDIFEADYGRTFHLIGPAGELWHMMDANKNND
jgi:hypothetical protein